MNTLKSGRQAVKNFFDKLFARIRRVGKYSNATAEQRIVERGVKKMREELEERFVEALKAANIAARASADLKLAEQSKTIANVSNTAKTGGGEAVTTTDDSNSAVSTPKSNLTSMKSGKMHDNGGDLSYSIVELDDGKQYVEASEKQIIKGTDPRKWAIQVANYINKVIRNGNDLTIKTTSGDYLTITRDTAYKAVTRNQVRNPDGTYRTMTDAEYLCK